MNAPKHVLARAIETATRPVTSRTTTEEAIALNAKRSQIGRTLSRKQHAKRMAKQEKRWQDFSTLSFQIARLESLLLAIEAELDLIRTDGRQHRHIDRTRKPAPKGHAENWNNPKKVSL